MVTLNDIKLAATYVLDNNKLNSFTCVDMEKYLHKNQILDVCTDIENIKLFEKIRNEFVYKLQYKLYTNKVLVPIYMFTFVTSYRTIAMRYIGDAPTARELRTEWLEFIINYKE